MNGFARYAIAAVAVIAIGAVGLAVLQPGTGPGVGGPAPSPTASPTPITTPAATRSPATQTAEVFRRPFTYVLPAGTEFDSHVDGSTYFELRVPAFAEAGTPSGVIVQAIGGRRTDPCAERSSSMPLAAAGPQAVLAYLQTLPQLEVTNGSDTTVGGLPAVQATVVRVVGTSASSCPEIWPWGTSTEPIPAERPVRILAMDVEGEHIVLTVFGEADNPAWDTMADELIGTFRFLPATSPPASPGPS
jgi:hypothetical protein